MLENGPSGGAATGAVFSSDALRGNSNTRPLLPSVTVGFRSNQYSFPGNRMLALPVILADLTKPIDSRLDDFAIDLIRLNNGS